MIHKPVLSWVTVRTWSELCMMSSFMNVKWTGWNSYEFYLIICVLSSLELTNIGSCYNKIFIDNSVANCSWRYQVGLKSVLAQWSHRYFDIKNHHYFLQNSIIPIEYIECMWVEQQNNNSLGCKQNKLSLWWFQI